MSRSRTYGRRIDELEPTGSPTAGKYLMVFGMQRGFVSSDHGVTFTPKETYALGGKAAISHTGKVVHSTNNSVLIYDIASSARALWFHGGATITEDGTIAYMTHYSGRYLTTKYNVANLRAVSAWNLSAEDYGDIATSYDGRVVAASYRALYLSTDGGGSYKRLVGSADSIAVSPSGAYIAIRNGGTCRVSSTEPQELLFHTDEFRGAEVLGVTDNGVMFIYHNNTVVRLSQDGSNVIVADGIAQRSHVAITGNAEMLYVVVPSGRYDVRIKKVTGLRGSAQKTELLPQTLKSIGGPISLYTNY